ncbi:MAG: AraC family transcriptional regulator [Mariniphaga sp.]|nr:AraC family transcriptional regulator [Mariniphaga sp.]
MSFQIAKPSALLSPYIKHYWALENCVSNGNEYTQRIVPSGLMELIFYLEEKPESLDPKKSIPENTCISGQQKEFYDLTVKGRLSLFSVLFQPQGAMMFFNIPAKELYNQNVPLNNILKNQVSKIESNLYEANSFQDKINIIEKFMLQQLHKHHKLYEFKRISNSISHINRLRGIANIEFLSNQACLSRKQYERSFTEFIGTSPKQFLKIVRFQNTLNQKEKNKNYNLTQLAYNCGYYDQAHMINEFRQLSGMTPKQFFSECESYSDYFQ